MKIAIQGELGSFHQLAAEHFYGSDSQLVCRKTFQDVFNALKEQTAEAAIVAIENSLYGSITEVYDLLQAYHFPIVGEVAEHIHQNLITLPGATLADITEVYSHPVALAQCDKFLQTSLAHAEKFEHFDTADAVALIKQKGDPGLAAIASSKAADMHGLQILAPSIQDETQNFTRFLAVQPDATPPLAANKSSLIFATTHQPGALHAALSIFAERGINLTKLQSRPIPGKVWQYEFYLDVETAGLALYEVTEQLTQQDCTVTVLGEYCTATTAFED